MTDASDIARIGYVAQNYDAIDLVRDKSGNPVYSKKYYDRLGKPAPLVTMVKRIDGFYYISEAVPDARAKTLRVTSAYKNNKGAVWAPDVKTPGNSTSETTPYKAPINSLPDSLPKINLDLSSKNKNGAFQTPDAKAPSANTSETRSDIAPNGSIPRSEQNINLDTKTKPTPLAGGAQDMTSPAIQSSSSVDSNQIIPGSVKNNNLDLP